MTDKQSIWLCAGLCCLAIIAAGIAVSYYTIKGNECLVKAVKVAAEYRVPVERTLELCK